MLNRAVFLDRDGTINEELGYLSDVDELRLIEGAPTAIARLNQRTFKVVVVTNQAGVARGYFTEGCVQHIHAVMQQRLQHEQAYVDAFYYCPHHPTEGIGSYKIECNCRKPKPGMLKAAAREFRIDLSHSFIVGDQLSDLAAGHAVGCRGVLVQTGFGYESQKALANYPFQPDFIAADILEACRWILQQ